MKKSWLFLIIGIVLAGCARIEDYVDERVVGTLNSFTPIPTYTPYPTSTPYPTLTAQPTVVITKIVVRTPIPDRSDDRCKPMTNMNYEDNNKAFVMLQAYVATLPDVRQVSYTIPEKLYSNSLSHIVHVTYVSDSDGEKYSRRYLVYLSEFGWKKGVFSIDGQCWIDGPKY